ncbi:MAG: hypothetical protein AAF629_32005, partial [Chloroflexota bacterium]
MMNNNRITAMLRSSRLIRLPIFIGIIGLLLLWPTIALAHPLGNFTINRFSRLTLSQTEINILYVVDMAEVPAYQTFSLMDLDEDGMLSQSEHETYLRSLVTDLQSNLFLLADGQPLAILPAEAGLDFPEGQGGLPTIRAEIIFVASLPSQ